MAEKRVYAFSCPSCIRDSINRSGDTCFGWYECTLAADKDLVYVMYTCPATQAQQHIMYSPTTNKCYPIPKPNIRISSQHANNVVMSVDNATQSYRIVVIELYKTNERQEFHLYDSTSMQWRKLCQAPDNYRTRSSIFLKGVLYTLFVDILGGLNYKLFSCDLESGAWRYINVALPRGSHPRDGYQLVVTLGRLFFVKYTGRPPQIEHARLRNRELASEQVRTKIVIRMSIWEIVLGEQEVRKVVGMRKFAKYPYTGDVAEWQHKNCVGDLAAAVGCGNSIVILSWIDRCTRFDLLRKCWCELPFKDLKQLFGCCGTTGIFASLVDF